MCVYAQNPAGEWRRRDCSLAMPSGDFSHCLSLASAHAVWQKTLRKDNKGQIVNIFIFVGLTFFPVTTIQVGTVAIVEK